MTKNFRAVKASIIMCILVFSTIAVFIGGASGEDTTTALGDDPDPKWFSFNSYIDIEYDATPLNENLEIDQSINVPLTIKYSTDVPENFLQLMPDFLWQIKNLILFGSTIGPMQKLHLEIADQPDWANIYISQPDMFVAIPIGTEVKTVTTSLIISPREEAPAVSHRIDLKATCDTIGRINGVTYQESVEFTPSFVPTIQITPENPTRTVSPQEAVNFKITIENNANKKTRVTPELVNPDSKWTSTINPPFHDIQPGGKEEFTFSIYAPYDFGWHNEIRSFQIDFTAKIFPLRDDAPVGGPYSIYLRVNNHGFSVPGFEVLPLLAAIVIVGIIMKKRYTI